MDTKRHKQKRYGAENEVSGTRWNETNFEVRKKRVERVAGRYPAVDAERDQLLDYAEARQQPRGDFTEQSNWSVCYEWDTNIFLTLLASIETSYDFM